MNHQLLKSKMGEVKYRAKLVQQYQGKNGLFENEPDKKEIIKTLKDRLSSTRKDLIFLKNEGVEFEPYLEVGAEFGHRAGLLEEKYGASGFALDLSFESLSSFPGLSKKLGLNKTPRRICADAYRLPFANNSFNFVFCYQTLHHFPDPAPIIKEIHRVLAPGGYFFVNEEPVRQSLNLNLWRRPTKLRGWEKALKYLFLLPFISQIGKTETEYGILEESFPLKIWERSLSDFEDITAWLTTYPFGIYSKNVKRKKENWLRPNLLSLFFIFTLGGGIKILARKAGNQKNQTKKIGDLICCPVCHKRLSRELSCSICRIKYQHLENIDMLLSSKLDAKLYPNLKKS